MNYTIFFTNQCNMGCTYCYEHNKKASSISYEVLDKTVDFIVKQYSNGNDKGVSIVTHGGEPLLEFEKIKYFIEKLNSRIRNVQYIITTNATLLTDKIADYLIENYTEISISIDGNAGAHNSNRVFLNGIGTYDIVARNARRILAKDKSVKARMTVTPQTVENLFESVKHLIELGFTSISPVADSFCGDWTDESIGMLIEQGKLITDYVANYPTSLNIGLINDALVKRVNSPCSGGLSTFSVDTDGSIYPCIISVGMPEFQIGNVSTGIIENKVQEISKWNSVDIPECMGCSRYNYCSTTRCRIVNKAICGDLHTPSPFVCGLENARVKISEYYMKVFPHS